ncbi:type VII toxin-antitoxin system HepT family RNase toxin [Endozoicomonas sp. ALD040]|uniref:type VII toxin-antitoxin system HepT family RNase toxin n=1 Tax=Endozoicomonas sp. ALD040 TaxID=3403079 RepID=UPI003BB1D3B8
MNDKAYEQEIENVQQEMILILDELHDDLGSWRARDMLAAQRALQILIESLIGLSRYVYQEKFGVKVTKSRAAIDGLEKRNALTRQDYDTAMKMIGFRNVVVHDYLDVNRNILEAIIKNKFYRDIQRITLHIQSLL